MRAVLLILLAASLLAPAALAQDPAERLDVRITIHDSGEATVLGEGARFVNSTPNEHYVIALNLTKTYTTFEVLAGSSLALERPRQFVPVLLIPEGEPFCATEKGVCDYPLFHQFPNDEIWDVDYAARVFFANGSADSFSLRLGVPGPVNATLLLHRDVTPPNYTLRPVQNITTFSFYQETVTDELVLADLQVREQNATEWVQNPTPVYHYFQRFPIQGLDADKVHEARVLFTDWAENVATSPTYLVRTAPEPGRPIPLVTPAQPLPNSTVPRENILIRATFTSPESPVEKDGARLFLDKKEITEGLGFSSDSLAFVPGDLAPGRHSVSVEITNEAGGTGIAIWSFEVEGKRVPAAAALLTVGALLFVALARRR